MWAFSQRKQFNFTKSKLEIKNILQDLKQLDVIEQQFTITILGLDYNIMKTRITSVYYIF